MQTIYSFLPISRRLFIDLVDEFQLTFCVKDKHYVLKNPFRSKCHVLELCLIPDGNYTGYKIYDISKKLNVSFRWILGFYDGFKENKIRFRNKEYTEGYLFSKKFKSQNLSLV